MIKLSVTTAGFSECLSKDSGDSAGVCIISLNLPGPALWKKEEKKNQIPDRIIQRNFLGNLFYLPGTQLLVFLALCSFQVDGPILSELFASPAAHPGPMVHFCCLKDGAAWHIQQ